MVFSSLEFLFLFLPIVFILYYASPVRLNSLILLIITVGLFGGSKPLLILAALGLIVVDLICGWYIDKFKAPLFYRNLVLLVVSLAFYGWGEPKYIVLVCISVLNDYTCGYFTAKYRETDKRKARYFVIAAVTINLLLLCVFKYGDFAVSNLRLIPGLSWLQPPGLELPIGISFYTFQTMSYTIDIYRGEAKVQKNIITFGSYVALFPQLTAGPIVRYKDIGPQLVEREISLNMFSKGVRTFICGLAKKVLLANTAAEMWKNIRGLPGSEMSALTAWMGVIAFTFQIYFDFSGYSDMAIGLGKMFGFNLLENFNYPYISKSITEFWRRWHISLSTWFREYVYIPLGGNRKGKAKQYRNLAIVWLLTGLWHGASWNYVLWGAYFAVILIIEKAFLGKLLERAPAVVRHAYALVFIVLGWWLFTFENIGAGFVHLSYMFGAGGGGLADQGAVYDLLRLLPYFIVFIIGSTPLPKKVYYGVMERFPAASLVSPAIGGGAVLLCVAFLVNSSYNPFLYFRF